jgi:hypothetical protein
VTGKVREHGGGGGRVRGTMVEPEKRPPREPKVDSKSQEYRRPLGRRAAASAECGKAARNRGKSLPFSWPVHRYSDPSCEIRVFALRDKKVPMGRRRQAWSLF